MSFDSHFATGDAPDEPRHEENGEERSQEEQHKPQAKPRRPRGFAAMDRKRVSEIASKGGRAAHRAGTAHEFTSEEARSAGRKGGTAPHVRRGSAQSAKQSA